jgi:hypothetical protein
VSSSARFCGRDFSPGELEPVRAIIAQSQVCRSQLARQVCQEFGWLNAQGRLKEMSCKVALLRMERAGLLVLPPPGSFLSKTPNAANKVRRSEAGCRRSS